MVSGGLQLLVKRIEADERRERFTSELTEQLALGLRDCAGRGELAREGMLEILERDYDLS